MRIRSIKPEFWRSSSISELEIEDRLLFIGLWSYVDDNGVGEDRDSLIAADLFADDISRDPRETFARVSRGLQHLSAAGRITRYEVAGRPYLEITGWTEHQRIDRPAKARYPHVTSPDAVIRDTLATPSRGLQQSSRLEQGNRGTGEQGNRGTGPTSSSLIDTAAASSADADGEDDEIGAELIPFTPEPARPDLDADFAAWWNLYPRKVGKGAAQKAYRSARKKATAEALAAAIDAQGPLLMARGSQYCPHPATWLNGERWRDNPADLQTTDSRQIDWAALHARAEQIDNQGGITPW